jgi:TRAP-type C4-dicarboxylate transport system substrate-binding protein
MHRGVVDSIVFPVGAGKAFKLEEVIKYVYKCEFFSYHLHLAMNLDTWKRLPKDLQEAVMRASRKAEQVSGFHYENQDALSFDLYKAKKIEIYEPTDAELKELKASVAGLKEKMVADLEKNGLPGKKTLARMEELIQKYRAMGNIEKLKMTY